MCLNASERPVLPLFEAMLSSRRLDNRPLFSINVDKSPCGAYCNTMMLQFSLGVNHDAMCYWYALVLCSERTVGKHSSMQVRRGRWASGSGEVGKSPPHNFLI